MENFFSSLLQTVEKVSAFFFPHAASGVTECEKNKKISYENMNITFKDREAFFVAPYHFDGIA